MNVGVHCLPGRTLTVGRPRKAVQGLFTEFLHQQSSTSQPPLRILPSQSLSVCALNGRVPWRARTSCGRLPVESSSAPARRTSRRGSTRTPEWARGPASDAPGSTAESGARSVGRGAPARRTSRRGSTHTPEWAKDKASPGPTGNSSGEAYGNTQ